MSKRLIIEPHWLHNLLMHWASASAPAQGAAQAAYDAKTLELHGAFASPNVEITPMEGNA